MDAKICDRYGKVCTEKDSIQVKVGVVDCKFFDLCKDCERWFMNELRKKKKWEEKE